MRSCSISAARSCCDNLWAIPVLFGIATTRGFQPGSIKQVGGFSDIEVYAMAGPKAFNFHTTALQVVEGVDLSGELQPLLYGCRIR